MITKYLVPAIMSLNNHLETSGYFVKPVGRPSVDKDHPYLTQDLEVSSESGYTKRVVLHIDGEGGLYTGQFKSGFLPSYQFPLSLSSRQEEPGMTLKKYLKLRVSSLSSQSKIQELSNRIARLENMKAANTPLSSNVKNRIKEMLESEVDVNDMEDLKEVVVDISKDMRDRDTREVSKAINSSGKTLEDKLELIEGFHENKNDRDWNFENLGIDRKLKHVGTTPVITNIFHPKMKFSSDNWDLAYFISEVLGLGLAIYDETNVPKAEDVYNKLKDMGYKVYLDTQYGDPLVINDEDKPGFAFFRVTEMAGRDRTLEWGTGDRITVEFLKPNRARVRANTQNELEKILGKIKLKFTPIEKLEVDIMEFDEWEG